MEGDNDAHAGRNPRLTNVETRIYALGGLRDGSPSEDMFVYAPLVYQFFIPAASTGGD